LKNLSWWGLHKCGFEPSARINTLLIGLPGSALACSAHSGKPPLFDPAHCVCLEGTIESSAIFFAEAL